MITSSRGLKLTELKEYDKRLLSFVREYNAVNHFPATLNVMLENLPEIKSKSTVHLHLQKLVQMGYLKQVGKKRSLHSYRARGSRMYFYDLIQ